MTDATENLGERVRHLETLETATDHVLATTATPAIPGTSTWTNLVFTNEIHDTNSEYNPATGIFTAKRSGFVLVSFHYIYDTAVWGAGKFAQSRICKNGAAYLYSDLANTWAVINAYISQQGTATIPMSIGNTANIQAWQNSGGNKTPLGASYSHVNFDWLF